MASDGDLTTALSATRDVRARDHIVRYAARLYERGLVAGASGNISLRLSDGDLLVTPSGASLRTLKAADIVRCAPDGRARDGDARPTSELRLHLAAYRSRADARALIHTHPTYTVAWSKSGRLFPLETVGALESLGPVALVAYAPSGTQQLADFCAAAFARGIDTVVMERHGLSALGPDLETAFNRTDLAEQTACIEFAASVLSVAKT